jgi:Mrp family chromosome partitioning ATPase
MGLADAPLLASAVEGTVFVAQANGTHKNVVEVAVGRLQDASAHILGLILTKFDSRRAYYGHGYDYGYGYGEAEPERA